MIAKTIIRPTPDLFDHTIFFLKKTDELDELYFGVRQTCKANFNDLFYCIIVCQTSALCFENSAVQFKPKII